MNPKFTLTLASCICFSLLAIQPYSFHRCGKRTRHSNRSKEGRRKANKQNKAEHFQEQQCRKDLSAFNKKSDACGSERE